MATNLAKQYDEEELKKLKKAEVNILYDFIQVCEKHNINYFLAWGTAIGAVRHHGFIPWDDDIDVGMLREDYDKFVAVVEQEMGANYKLTTPVTEKGYAGTVAKLQRKGTKFVPYISRTMKCDLCLHIDLFIYDNMDNDVEAARKNIKKTRHIAHVIFLCGSPYPVIKIKGIKGAMAKTACFMAHYIFKLLHVSMEKQYEKFEQISKSSNHKETAKLTSYQSLAAFTNSVTREDIFPLKDIEFEDLIVKIPNQYDKMLRQTYGDYMQLPKEEDRVNHGAYVIDFGDESVLKRNTSTVGQ